MGKSSAKDFSGQTIKNFKVIEFVGHKRDKNGVSQRLWKCECICGKIVVLTRKELTRSAIKSCGCLTSKYISDASKTHGFSKTRLYHEWLNIKDRCANPKSSAYKYYGGRGIAICDEWSNDFLKFREWALSHGYTDTLSIERVNVNGNYEPDNCCWIPRSEQCKNTRWNKYYTLNGETHSTVEWSRLLGGSPSLIGSRLKRGWSLEKALTTPRRKGNYRRA